MLLFCRLACLLAWCRPSSSPLSTLASGRTTTLSSFSTWPTTSELCHGGLALAARPPSLGLVVRGVCLCSHKTPLRRSPHTRVLPASGELHFLVAGVAPQMGIGILWILESSCIAASLKALVTRSSLKAYSNTAAATRLAGPCAGLLFHFDGMRYHYTGYY